MKVLRFTGFFFVLAWSIFASAEDVLTPQQIIKNTTDRVTAIIEESKSYYDSDPQRYFTEIGLVLGKVVDFDSFSRGVMGKYASKKEYNKLPTAEQKAAYRARMDRFSKVFRTALIETYGKGLLAFTGNKIEVLDDVQPDPESGSVTVVQHIYSESEQPYVVLYKMRQDQSGDWKLRNVTIEGVNLGKVYQRQFASAVKQYNGDVDQVIDNWVVASVRDEQQADAR